MNCPYCQGRLLFQVGNNKVQGISCDGNPPHEIKKDTTIFNILSEMYFASEDKKQREENLTRNYLLERRDIAKIYQEVMDEFHDFMMKELGIVKGKR